VHTIPTPSLLFVATVASTIRGFLIPYASHFRGLGWRVDAAANGASDDAALGEAFDHVYDLPFTRSILDIGGLIRGERAISRILDTRPDIVHVHTPIASFLTRLAVRRMPLAHRPSVVYTAHGFHFHRKGRASTNAVFLAAEKIAGRWTDRLIVINDEDHEAAVRNRIVARRALVRMPGIGLDTGVYAPSAIQTEPGMGPGGPSPLPTFVSVAELNRGKRHADTIEALALLRHREARLVLLGDGAERSNLEDLATSRGIRDRVTFAGFVQDVRPVVGNATAFVLASGREGLARSVMEALALQVPVIASAARGNSELVPPDSGIIVPIGDVRGLAAAMDWIIEHPDERVAMGRRGRERMVEQYDIARLIDLHDDLYRALLAERQGKDG
jgi:glycosyltransferase involved in cell wall biosynthesis